MTVSLRAGGVVLVISLVAASVQAQQPEKNPVPDDLTQEESRKAAADLYKRDYTKAKGNKEALAKLAKSMLEDAAKAKDDVVSYYVLLHLAKSVATEAGDGKTAMSALDRIGESYNADTLELKADCLRKIGGSKAADYISLAEQAFSLVDEAVAKNEYELAKQLVKMAREGARRSKDYDLAKKALAREKELESQAKQFKGYQQALKTLEGDPSNAEANLAAGRYLCFHKGEWERGVPMLALGSDKGLKSAAEKELQGPIEANEQFAVAEAWWMAAEQAKGKDKEALMLHAGGWYERAKSSGVSGIAKVKVDDRLREIAKIGQPAPDIPAVVERPKPKPGRVDPSARKGQPPDLARAPFNMVEAKNYQLAWARYLRVPVEWRNPIGMVFVLIPSGEFTMGSPETERRLAISEEPHDKNRVERIQMETLHRVRITKPFYLGKYEVTQAQWQAVMGNNPSEFQGPANPVELVSWQDIQPFLAKLNTAYGKEELKFGLPTEAQWEYACRAGTTTAFYFGNNSMMLSQFGWFKGNARGTTHPVGQRMPNAWGLHDMHGNLWELCSDRYAVDYYGRSPVDDPVGPEAGGLKLRRGGCWDHPAAYCRSARRSYHNLGGPLSHTGFRVAAILPEKPSE